MTAKAVRHLPGPRLLIQVLLLTLTAMHAPAEERDIAVFKPFDKAADTGSDDVSISQRGQVAIGGWSRDGKVFLKIKTTYVDSWQIIDSVTDKILLDKNYDVMSEAEKSIVDKATNKYGIRPVSGRVAPFPLTRASSGVYSASLQLRKKVDEYNNLYAIVITRQDANGITTTKTVSQLTARADSGYYRIEETVFLYALSPFEYRILVIAALPNLHAEFDYLYYDFHFTGCHLSTGF
jgi:hypothetical protein